MESSVSSQTSRHYFPAVERPKKTEGHLVPNSISRFRGSLFLVSRSSLGPKEHFNEFCPENSKRKTTMASQDETAAAAAAAALEATALADATASDAPAAAAPDAPAPDGPSSSSAEEQKVDPWNVSAGKDGKVDYDKLSRDVRIETFFFCSIENDYPLLRPSPPPGPLAILLPSS